MVRVPDQFVTSDVFNEGEEMPPAKKKPAAKPAAKKKAPAKKPATRSAAEKTPEVAPAPAAPEAIFEVECCPEPSGKRPGRAPRSQP